MSTVEPDSVLAQADLQVAAGQTTARRGFLVQGLTGNASAGLYNATRASGIPLEGDPHPVIPGAVVTRITARYHSRETTVATVEVEYQTPSTAASQAVQVFDLDDPVEVEYLSYSGSEEVIEDRFGKRMTLGYVTTGELTLEGSSLSREEILNRVQIERPGTTISITRTVKQRPDILTRDFRGVNSDSWDSYQPQQVRCDGFTGTRGANGLFRVRGLFTPSPFASGNWKNAGTWDQAGVVPPNVREGNGITIFEVYPLVNFSRHGFTQDRD